MKKFFGFGGKKSLPSSPQNPYGYHIQEEDLGKIHRAATMGDVGKVRRILWLGINGKNDRDKMNRTALHLACANGHARVVTLLAKGRCQLNFVDNENKTALIKAVQCQEEECTTILLVRGADPNVTDADGDTALHHAVLGQNTAIVAKLLAHKANMRAINKAGFTPLSLAVSEKKEHMVEVLVKNAAEVEPSERPALHSACANGNIEEVNILAHSKILLNLVDNENKTALIKAVQCQQEECTAILLDRGADPNVTDANGNTALHHAALGQNTAIVAKLLAHKANTKAINKDGLRPFSLAISDNTEEMVEFFVTETARIKQLESNHQQTSVYKTESRSESLSESSKSVVVDKKSEEDSLSSLSFKPNIDDPWPTSEDEDYDFDTKKVMNPDLAKLLAGFPRFPKTKQRYGIVRPENRTLCEDNAFLSETEDVVETLPSTLGKLQGFSVEEEEATKPAIEEKGNDKISALGEDEDADSPWDSESVSSSAPQNYVVYLPEAADQRGKNTLNGQVEDSPEKISSSKSAGEVKDPLPKKAVGMISEQTSRSDSPEKICSSKAAVEVKDPLPKKALRMNCEQTSRSDSPERFSSSKRTIDVTDRVPQKVVGTNSVHTSRSDSPERFSSSKRAIDVTDRVPQKVVGTNSVRTSRSDSPERFSSSKRTIDVTDRVPQKVVGTNSVHTSRSDSPERFSSSKRAIDVTDRVPQKVVGTNSVRTSRSDSPERFSSSKRAIDVTDRVPQKVVGTNSVHTSRSDSPERFSSSKRAIDVTDRVPPKVVGTNSVRTSRSDSPERFSSSKHAIDVTDRVPQKVVGTNSVHTSRSDSPERFSSSKRAIDVTDRVSQKVVGTNSVRTSRSDSPERFSSSKRAIDVTDRVPQKVVGTNSVHTSRSDSPERFSSSKRAIDVTDRVPPKVVGTNSVRTSRSDSPERFSSSKRAIDVTDRVPQKVVGTNSVHTSRSDSPERFSSSKRAIDVTDRVPPKVVGTNSVRTSRSDSPERFSSSKHAIDVTDRVPQKVVGTNSVHTSRSDSPERFSSSKRAIDVTDRVPQKVVGTNSVRTSRSDSLERFSSSKHAIDVTDRVPQKVVGTNSVHTSRSDSLERFSSSKHAIDVTDRVPQKVVGTNSVHTSRSDSPERFSSSKRAIDVTDRVPQKVVGTNSVHTSRSDYPEVFSFLQPQVKWKVPVLKNAVGMNSVPTSRSAKLDSEVASGVEEERLDGSENNHPQASHSYEQGKRLLHEEHMLQADVAQLRLEIDIIKNQYQEMENKIENIVIVKENNDLLRKTVKVIGKTLKKPISQYNGQLNVLTAKNSALKSKLEAEKKDKKRLETEIESYWSRLAAAVEDPEQSESSKRDLQRDFQQARHERLHLRDQMNYDISDLQSKNEILSQKLSETESKFSKLEIELHNTREALRERSLVLEGVQKDLSLTQCQKKEIEHRYQKQQDKVNEYIEKQGSLEERLSQLQTENVLLRQQLDDAHNKGKTAIHFKDQVQDIMKMFETKSEKRDLMLNEKYMELINIGNHLKERMHEYETSKAEKDATVRPLQQELAGSLKNRSVSEASLQTTSHSHRNLEDETLDIKKKLDPSRSQNDDVTAELVTVSSKCPNLDEESNYLQQELVSTKALLKKYEKLKDKYRNLELEVVNLLRHMPVNTTELSEGAQCHRKAEERARRDEEAESEASRFSQRQAASQENLEKLKEIHHALAIRQLEFKSNHLESELSKIKTSHDSKEKGLEKYRQLYLKEVESKQSLRNELNKSKDRLAEADIELLQKWQNRSSLSTFNPKVDLETACEENFDNFSLSGNPTQRYKLASSVSQAWTSPDMKMRQEFEKTLTRELEEDAAEFEAKAYGACPVASADSAESCQDLIFRTSREYAQILRKNYMI